MAVNVNASELSAAVVVDAPGGPLTIFESADVDRDLDDAIALGRPAPYGRVLWSSGRAVAWALASWAAGGIAGRRVVELGCGTGLVSLVAARLGARVLATDVDDGCLALLRQAAAAAGVVVDTATFDVRGALPLPPADVYVAADVIYEPELAAALARRVREAKDAGAVVVVGDPGRVFRAQFARLLAEGGIDARFTRTGSSTGGNGDVGVAVI